MINNAILITHVLAGFLMFVLSVSPVLFPKATKWFGVSIVTAAVSGLFMMVRGSSLTSVCVRMVSLTLVAVALFVLMNRIVYARRTEP